MVTSVEWWAETEAVEKRIIFFVRALRAQTLMLCELAVIKDPQVIKSQIWGPVMEENSPQDNSL